MWQGMQLTTIPCADVSRHAHTCTCRSVRQAAGDAEAAWQVCAVGFKQGFTCAG